MQKKKFKWIALVLTALLALGSCQSAASETKSSAAPEAKTTAAAETSLAQPETGKKKVIGVSLYYRRDEYYKDLDTAFQKYGNEKGFEMIIQDADTNVATQTRQIEDFITRGVDAIALAATDPDGIIPVIQQAVEAGIPVVTYDGDANTDLKSSFIGFNFTEDGQIVGKWAREYIEKNLGGKAEVAVLDYPKSPIVCAQRASGFIEEVSKLPGVKIVAQQDGKATRADSMTAMENILTANPNVNLVYGINFDTAAGANAALEAAGKKDVVVTGNGYGKEMFEALENNNTLMKAFACSMAQIQAKDTVETIDKVLRGESVPKETLSHSLLLSTDNIKDFDWRSEVAR